MCFIICHIHRDVIQSINIIVVTHSPFILSDIPAPYILYLPLSENKVKRNTFGGNVYDLLKDSFFLDSAIGDFAQSKLDEILSVYNQQKNNDRRLFFLKKHVEFRFTISQLGEPYLQNAFRYMVEEMEREYLPTKQIEGIDGDIKNLENEIERLKRRKEQLRNRNIAAVQQKTPDL